MRILDTRTAVAQTGFFGGLLLAVVVSSGVAAASGPTSWVQSSYEDFQAGQIVSVSLGEDGDLRLAPELGLIADTKEAFVWAVDEAVDGTVFAAAGTEGKVLRMGPGATEPELFFEASGTVHAVEIGPDNNLYVAASPGGSIWRLPLDGSGANSEPWLETGVRYAWSLAFGADGTLYVGTGGDGVILRAGEDGEVETLFDSGEKHITALAVDRDGNVLAGSSDNGHVYRVSPAGDVFVLFDSPLTQITGIVPTDEGIYVAGVKREAAAAGSGSNGQQATVAAPTTGSNGKAGAVYLIQRDGFVEELWASETESPHALEAAAPGVVVGTGPEGRLLRVRPGPEVAILQDADAGQVTALRGRGPSLIMGTSNLGRVYRLAETYGTVGEYISQVKDTATSSQWGRIRWRGMEPAGTTIRLYTRAGNTEAPDGTWSDWTGPYSDGAGSVIDSPPARFIQWKAVLRTDDTSRTPVLQWIEVVYVQRNLRPEFEDFAVHPGGVVYRRTGSFEDSLPIGQLPSPVERALALQQGRDAVQTGATGPTFMGRPFYVPGSRTFTWDASDANGDRLEYSLFYRGEGESVWKPIAVELDETMHTWDTTTVPDGLYRARVVASDAPSNPDGQELEGRSTSQPFVIDNTPPSVGSLSGDAGGDGVRVTGAATDSVSLIRSIEYAVDGGEWHAVLPADGLADSSDEQIDFAVEGLGPGEHTIVVRVTDNALNGGVAKTVVVLQ